MQRASLAALALSLSALALGCGATHRPDGGVGMLDVGAKVPDLEAVDQHGTHHKLSDEHGHPVVVYFYPRDSTPGCTTEACAFRDVWDSFAKAGVQVFGVSEDDEASHDSFAKEHKLPFPLLVDPSHAWVNAFGVTTRLGMASRVSFLLDGEGKVARVYPNVDPGRHAADVLKDAAALPH